MLIFKLLFRLSFEKARALRAHLGPILFLHRSPLAGKFVERHTAGTVLFGIPHLDARQIRWRASFTHEKEMSND